MKKITVLGSGMVGKAIAIDLSQKYKVQAVDQNKYLRKEYDKLENAYLSVADLSKQSTIKRVIKDCDLVINALPGFMGYQTLKTIINEKKNVVDISFFPEEPFKLNKLAQKNQVTAIIDCGVAPGMSNILLGYHYHNMKVTDYKCYVGGLPVNPVEPFKYKAPFSPVDVLEEYTRPARLVENGEIVEKPALSEPEGIHFDETGSLVAFNTDGLRTLLKTIDVPNMSEKTLRYPGHRKIMSIFIGCGFFDKKPISMNGCTISPLNFTSKILLPHWKLKPGEKEFTVMLVKIKGSQDGREIEHIYELYDEYNIKTRTSSMARTTGYTCTAAAKLILEENYDRKGIIPPEYLGINNKDFNYILDYQKQRGITYKHQINDFE